VPIAGEKTPESAPSLPEPLQALDPLFVDIERRKGLQIRRYAVRFAPCTNPVGPGLDERYSAMPQVVLEGHALFPQLALLALFQKEGWRGVWADIHHRKYFTTMPQRSKGITLEPHVSRALARITAERPGASSGCWDLVLWHDRLLLFVLARSSGGSPAIRGARLEWLEASLMTGLLPRQFIVVEWSAEEPRTVIVRRKRGSARPA
jgi:hypothetical protein